MAEEKITEAILSLGRQTPLINQAPGEKYLLENLDYGMTIGIAVTDGGRQFACWVGGGDNAKAFFLLSYSDDGGRNWQEPVLVIDPHDQRLPYDRCTIVGTLWLDPAGRLWLFFNQSLGQFDGASSNWSICCKKPDAAVLEWSEPAYIWYGCTLNKPLVLQDKSWLLPISIWSREYISRPFQDSHRQLDDLRMAHVFSSTDQAASWQRRGGVQFPDAQFDEHMLVQLKDGRLWLLARTKTVIMESYSADLGRSWTEPAAARIQSINARFHIRRLKSGNLLLIKHGQEVEKAAAERAFLTAFLSKDEAKTWSAGFLLDERSVISYPDADQDRAGRIYITYDRNRAQAGEIIMASVLEEEIWAGRLLDQESFLKRVILRPGRAPG